MDALAALHRQDLAFHALDVLGLEERPPADGCGVLDGQRKVHVDHDLLFDQLAQPSEGRAHWRQRDPDAASIPHDARDQLRPHRLRRRLIDHDKIHCGPSERGRALVHRSDAEHASVAEAHQGHLATQAATGGVLRLWVNLVLGEQRPELLLDGQGLLPAHHHHPRLDGCGLDELVGMLPEAPIDAVHEAHRRLT